MTTKLFSELGLSAETLKAIEKLGFEQASPIQAEAIPVLMTGADVVGQSQTGSGKTAAFAIPAIEKVNADLRQVQVLILCPTRELAVQVSEEVHKLALFKRGITALPVYGGQSYERQFWGLKQGAQIVIGTPGRVMDHMRRGTLKFNALKMVILDEVDVMLSTWHGGCGKRLHLCRVPVDFRQLGAVGETLAVAGNASQVGVDHHRISEDRSH